MDNLNKTTFEDLIEINEWIKEMDHLSLEFKEKLKKEKDLKEASGYYKGDYVDGIWVWN